MAVVALSMPRPGCTPHWLGRICLKYVNWSNQRSATRFVEMHATLQEDLAPEGGFPEGDPSDGGVPEGAPSVILRDLTAAGGIRTLVAIYNRSYVGAPDYRRAGWIQAMALQATRSYDPSLIWIAYQNGRPVGFLMARISSSGGRITGVGVLPEHRRQGIGTRLIRNAQMELRWRGESNVHLFVAEDNTDIRWMYHQMGFREV